ncbi:magnesium-translocating P-type ATPase [Flavihumibacter profundi]|uniref:magnesium-translocating P-type ATPase n=1 Tax=Flavihumibacter profundi TaxID=2716883 RepID=UPI001CC4FBE6|nr:magnesium-translocating P-type ATPase [Flavihumibacter profundi]MBZ5855546.1 magnesium-translocating P-type ATPase [Flavihumibacter profundi]
MDLLQQSDADKKILGLSLPEMQSAVGFIPGGLTEEEAKRRLIKYGFNEIASEKPLSPIQRIRNNIKNPLVILLAALGIVSFLTGDIRSTVVIFIMVILGIVLRYIQENRADKAAEKLKAMVSTHATVCRNGKDIEIPLKMLVPGDTVRLGSGDMVPADVRVLSAKDLFINQSSLTGESLAVEKKSNPSSSEIENPLELDYICFLGSNVESGTATAMVVNTGDKTSFGALASEIVGQQESTSFDIGINKFTWLMIRFIMVMVPAVFLINGFSRHNWLEAFLFALAVAVGLTPEMLPMIVTVNLSKGAISMSRKKVIVKRLNAIQNFGAMDVLCTDKTGTLTQGKIVLELHIDPYGEPSKKTLDFGFLNSYYQTGLKNLMDKAILDHEELEEGLGVKEKYNKIDEIPFDFIRKRMSVILEDKQGLNILICKGAVEGVMELCSKVEINGVVEDMSQNQHLKCVEKVRWLNGQGFRVVALAYKTMEGAPDEPVYTVKDESDMVLLGFLCFLDPPKDSATEALKRLASLKVDVKILTGDNEIITAYICKKVGVLVEDRLLLGAQIEKMDDGELAEAVNKYSVFARLVPVHKQRIIQALKKNGHVTGFMGDGINDAPALKVADVGISVDSAVDIAKESSDIILLENSLLVLEQGVAEGRRVFGNIIKYVKMAASSNFGNMFSVVGASAFLPYLPMLPIQVLTNNLLYDFSQTTIPTDNVDADWLIKPRKWAINEIQRFILFVGPISSVFDYVTFFILWHFFDCKNNPALFHTGWFVESLFTQTLIIHVIRTNKIPFIQSRASWPLMLTSLVIVAVGAWLTVSPLADTLGFVQLPLLYWVWLAGILICYVMLTQLIKNWFNRKYSMQ